MEDVTRKRILRKLEAIPDEQLYQVLDYIEFIEAKYAAATLRKPDALQQFAERLEDQMRMRALAPRAMRGTMKLVSTATRVLDGVRDLGRDIVATPERPVGEARPPDGGAPGVGEESVERPAGEESKERTAGEESEERPAGPGTVEGGKAAP